MIGATARKGQGSDNYDDFVRIFIWRVHQLIKLGYDAMEWARYATKEEPAITGDLVQKIREVLDAHKEPWLCFYSVHEEAPVTQTGRGGKGRRRIDIRLECSQRQPRSHFWFEAKRLGRNHPVGIYLGQEGLGRYLEGVYASAEDRAGMLGYVQDGDPADWAEAIRSEFVRDATNVYRTLEEHPWRACQIVGGMYTYHSGHDRPGLGKAMEIYHTLLLFCEG